MTLHDTWAQVNSNPIYTNGDDVILSPDYAYHYIYFVCSNDIIPECIANVSLSFRGNCTDKFVDPLPPFITTYYDIQISIRLFDESIGVVVAKTDYIMGVVHNVHNHHYNCRATLTPGHTYSLQFLREPGPAEHIHVFSSNFFVQIIQ